MSARIFCSASAAATRDSSVSLSSRRLASRARASYCRRRPRSAACARLTRVVGWNGRSRKVTLPSVSSKRLAAGIALEPAAALRQQDEGKVRPFRLGVDPGRQRAQVRRAQRLLGDQRRSRRPPTSSSTRAPAAPRRRSPRMPASPSIAAATSASRPSGARISARSDRCGIMLGCRSLQQAFSALADRHDARHAAQHALEIRSAARRA